MKLLKQIISDIYYASKVTNVGNKKLILLVVIILSQITAITDVALIVIFSSIITDSLQDSFTEPLVTLFLEYPYLIPLLVISRFLFTYTQSMT